MRSSGRRRAPQISTMPARRRPRVSWAPLLLSRKGLELGAPGRSPDSWILALRPRLPIPRVEEQWLPRGTRDLDGASHSQWRDRAGLNRLPLLPELSVSATGVLHLLRPGHLHDGAAAARVDLDRHGAAEHPFERLAP